MALIADYLDRMIVNTILVAVDGSPASVRAARAAVGFAHEHVSKVIVLAFSDCAEGEPAKAKGQTEEVRDSTYLIGEYALKARIPCEMHVLHSKSPTEDIVAEATRRHCDLIWLSAPGASNEAGHYLDTAITSEVLSKASVPVMLFRSRGAET